MAFTDKAMDKLFEDWIQEHTTDPEIRKGIRAYKMMIMSFLVYFLKNIIKGK